MKAKQNSQFRSRIMAVAPVRLYPLGSTSGRYLESGRVAPVPCGCPLEDRSQSPQSPSPYPSIALEYAGPLCVHQALPLPTLITINPRPVVTPSPIPSFPQVHLVPETIYILPSHPSVHLFCSASIPVNSSHSPAPAELPAAALDGTLSIQKPPIP